MYSSFHTNNTPLNEEASLGILEHLNKDELMKLLDDNGKMEELINDDQQIKRIEVDKENLLTSNRSVAEYNLSQEPKLASAKQQLANTYEDSVKVQKEFDEKRQQMDYKSSQYSLDTICALLQTEAAKSDEQSEKIAEDFLNGSQEVDTFLECYIPQRVVAHVRKVKSEKLVEMVRGGATSTMGGILQAGGVVPPIPAPRPSKWGAPYPTGSVPMPNAANYLPR